MIPKVIYLVCLILQVLFITRYVKVMVSNWVFHLESNRWFRSIYDHSGGYHYYADIKNSLTKRKETFVTSGTIVVVY